MHDYSLYLKQKKIYKQNIKGVRTKWEHWEAAC